MIKKITVPKIDENYQERLKQIGFGFHEENSVRYWVEDRGYAVSEELVDRLEVATKTVWGMCLDAVQHVIDNKLYDKFHIPSFMIPHIEHTWNMETPSLYGRFDFAYDMDTQAIKMLEFNADTPTSVYECGVIQWDWKETYFEGLESYDQFTLVDEQLINTFKTFDGYLKGDTIHFTCVRNSVEDLTTIEYLRDCAVRAGFKTKSLYIDEIGWNEESESFVDMQDEPITDIFKLYPWEWMVHEDFAKNIIKTKDKMNWIEPSWKMILSNKAIMPILWELFPNHENLLASYFEKPTEMTEYVTKPLLSREGANVSIYKDNTEVESTDGEYGEEGVIYQEFAKLPNLGEGFLILGSWVIGGEPSGMSFRESDNKITNNTSRFVPHVIEL